MEIYLSYLYNMRFLRLTSILLIFISSTNAYAQGQNNIWCFGQGAGLDFNGGPPATYISAINTVEGCASVCNASGNMLFYASPIAVYDRNNNIMPNGSGLSGSTSTTQGAVIIQSFTNPNQYYLFTLQEYFAPPNRLCYSVVDMSLNGGLGDVVVGQKNIPIDSFVGEKMIVARGAGCNNWLVTHHTTNPEFHVFKVDAGGVNPTPVISTAGFGTDYYVGEMKVSPSDSMIAVTNSTANGPLELYSFNNNTGIVSNAIVLDSAIWSYGMSFSPDGSKLYTTVPKIYQYDLSLLPNVNAVINSKTVINNQGGSGTRIGPDNKLYIIGTPISVINYPNLAGPACGYATTPFSANGGSMFPNIFVPSPINVTYNATHDTTACLLDTLTLSAPAGYDTYSWSDGKSTQTDTFTSAGTKWVVSTSSCGTAVDTFHVHAATITIINTATDTTVCLVNNVPLLSATAGYATYTWSDGKSTQTDTMSTPGTKWVIAKNNSCDIHTDTFHLHAAPIVTTTFAKDSDVCFINNIPIISAAPGYTSYTWSDGFTQQQDTFGSPGTKWVKAQNGCNIRIDTFKLHDWRDTTIRILDTSHCVAYSPITIYAPGGYTSYLWSDGKTTQVDTFFSTTTKWVRALNGCNLLVDTVHFTATTVPADSVTMHGNDTSICFELGTINVSAPGGYTYYLWSDGSSLQTDVFNTAATKWVYAQRLCYLLIDTFTVSAMPTDTTTSRTDTMFCFSNQATLSAGAGYNSYLWSDGNTGISDTFSQNAIKTVFAHKACAELIDTFHVQFINDLAVDLGADTSICKGETVRLDASSQYTNAQYLWQDGNTNKIYNATESGDYSVKVSVGPCSVSDTVRVHQKVIDIKLGNGVIPCHEDSLILDAGIANASYQWQDGSSHRTYKATKEGTYTVKVTQDECSATASVQVKFEGCECVVVLPTGFSPNGDGRNDKFGPTIACPINSYKMMIYNRWGNQVFYSEDVNNRWDGAYKGAPLDGDVFNYYLEFKDANHKTYYYKGTVTLVR